MRIRCSRCTLRPLLMSIVVQMLFRCPLVAREAIIPVCSPLEPRRNTTAGVALVVVVCMKRNALVFVRRGRRRALAAFLLAFVTQFTLGRGICGGVCKHGGGGGGTFRIGRETIPLWICLFFMVERIIYMLLQSSHTQMLSFEWR